MVYRGKPSASCGECRKRRNRCDQALPGCGQCFKTGRVCPGYRNMLGLMFHDESTHVAKRSKRLSQAQDGTLDLVQHQKEQPLPLPTVQFLLPLDDLGVHFFMSNYVGTGPAVQQMAYLPHFYQSAGYTNPALRKSIVASGLAGYGRMTGRQDLINVAANNYVSAIRAINTAISDSTSVIQDSTILSIVMAALYESMVTSEVSGMGNVCKHLEAAVHVAYHRLQQSTPDPSTHHLYLHLVQSVTMNCWIQHVPLPPFFMAIKKHALTQNSIHAKFLDLLPGLIHFRHALRDGTLTYPRTIIEYALQLDSGLQEFSQSLSRAAGFERFCVRSDERIELKQLVYGGHYHIYPVLFAAHLWNNVRSSRLHLHQVIYRQCCISLASPSSVKTYVKAQMQASEQLITSFITDIYATVPQLLGYATHLSPFSKSMREVDANHSQNTPSRKPGSSRDNLPIRQASPHPDPTSTSSTEVVTAASKHTFLVLPRPDPVNAYHILFYIYTMPLITWLPPSLKEWAIGRIEWIGQNVDRREFARLMEMIRKRPADWFPISEEEGYVQSPCVPCSAIERQYEFEADRNQTSPPREYI